MAKQKILKTITNTDLAIQKRDRDILLAHQEGMSVEALSTEFDLSLSSIYRILGEANIEVNPTTSKIDQETLENLKADYNSSMKVQDIIIKYKLSGFKAFYNILSSNNIPIRRYSQENNETKKIQLDTAIEMYENGYKLREIQAETGVYQITLHNELRIRKIPLRKERK